MHLYLEASQFFLSLAIIKVARSLLIDPTNGGLNSTGERNTYNTQEKELLHTQVGTSQSSKTGQMDENIAKTIRLSQPSGSSEMKFQLTLSSSWICISPNLALTQLLLTIKLGGNRLIGYNGLTDRLEILHAYGQVILIQRIDLKFCTYRDLI